jgi:outer membrane biosynthesis protein TonB
MGTSNVGGVVNRIAPLPLWAKTLLVLAALGLAVLLSPLTAVASLLGLAIAIVALVFQIFKGRPLRTWGFTALGSSFLLIAFTGASYALYGGSQQEQQVSAPVEKDQEAAQISQEATQEKTTKEKATQEETSQEKVTAPPDTAAENAPKTPVLANKEQETPSDLEQSATSEPASQKVNSRKTVTVTASPSIEEQGCRFFTQDEWTRATSEERAFISQCDQILRPSPDQGASAGSGEGGQINDRYYKNVDGIWVPSPDYSTDGSVPADATAQCADGTYSKSQHRRGTCSSHGGVSQWLP